MSPCELSTNTTLNCLHRPTSYVKLRRLSHYNYCRCRRDVCRYHSDCKYLDATLAMHRLAWSALCRLATGAGKCVRVCDVDTYLCVNVLVYTSSYVLSIPASRTGPEDPVPAWRDLHVAGRLDGASTRLDWARQEHPTLLSCVDIYLCRRKKTHPGGAGQGLCMFPNGPWSDMAGDARGGGGCWRGLNHFLTTVPVRYARGDESRVMQRASRLDSAVVPGCRHPDTEDARSCPACLYPYAAAAALIVYTFGQAATLHPMCTHMMPSSSVRRMHVFVSIHAALGSEHSLDPAAPSEPPEGPGGMGALPPMSNAG